MIAKCAQFPINGELAQRTIIMAAPCNDNGRAGAFAAGLPRNRRPVLLCRWHKVAPTGALVCTWQTEPADAAASEKPAIGWPFNLPPQPRPRYRHPQLWRLSASCS
jgi:hypothetical protein